MTIGTERGRRVRLVWIAAILVVAVVAGAVFVPRSASDDDATTTGVAIRATTTTTNEATSTTLGAVTTTTASSLPRVTTAVPAVVQSASPARIISPQPVKLPTSSRTTRPPPPKATGPCNSGDGGVPWNRIATLYCDHRESSGLPIMRRTAALDRVAQGWADQMAQKHEVPLPHNPDFATQVLAACPACSAGSENLGYSERDQPDTIWNLWLNSASHRATIDDGRSGEYGIGVAYSPDGYLWIVHDFGFY